MRLFITTALILISFSSFAQDTLITRQATADYINGINARVGQYTPYTAFISQTGTSAPVVTRIDNNFSGTTFTWGYSGIGTYTITASSPVFTAGRTAVIFAAPITSTQRFTYVLTSTTVITFNATVLTAVAALISTGTNGILSNVLVEIRVYT